MKAQPVEVRARVGFSSRRDITVANDVANRIARADPVHQSGKHVILRGRKRPGVAPLQFDADRKIVAALAAAPARHARMPGAPTTFDELDQLAVAPDQEMGRDTQACDRPEIRMGIGIEPIGEERLDVRPAEPVRRQADCVYDDQLDRSAARAFVRVRRCDESGARKTRRGIQIGKRAGHG